MTTRPAAKRFIVCAWNALGDKSNKWGDDPAGKSVSAFLRAHDWIELDSPEDEKDAELIVIAPRDRDKAMPIEDLAVFHTGLDGDHKKKVLYIHVALAATFPLAGVTPWLFVMQRGDFDIEALTEWLSDEQAGRPSPYPFDRVQQEIQNLQNRATQTTVDGQPNREEPPSFGRTCSELLNGGTRAQVFYGLYRICGKYNLLEHDINARLSSGEPTSHATADIAKKQLLDGYFDLCTAIAAHASFFTLAGRVECDTDADIDSDVRRNVVLLVDDRPDKQGFRTKASEMLQTFLPGLELWTWNPDELPWAQLPSSLTYHREPPIPDVKSLHLLHRRDVEYYSSLDEELLVRGDKKDTSWVLRINRQKSPSGAAHDKTDDIPLERVLARTRIVLVDLLFSDALGNDVEAGLGLIRGLQRICHDYRFEVERHVAETRSQTEEDAGKEGRLHEKWAPPEVVAISRASDLSKAHAVFRHGAGGFLPKDRLLGLPAMIARNIRPSPDLVEGAHRNFRLLYRLPQETISLLQDVRVPPVPFQLQTGRTAWEEKYTTAFAPLLAALPKADLHVHPGSCMTPEFLVAASLIMLLRHDPEAPTIEQQSCFGQLSEAIRAFSSFWDGDRNLTLCKQLQVGSKKQARQPTFKYGKERWNISRVAEHLRRYLLEQLEIGEDNRRNAKDRAIEDRYLELRSVLHKSLGVPDHHDSGKAAGKLAKLPCTTLFVFAMLHAGPGANGVPLLLDGENGKADLLRLFILWLATGGEYGQTEIALGASRIPVGRWFSEGRIDAVLWGDLRKLFYGPSSPYGVKELKRSGWRIPKDRDIAISVRWRRPLFDPLAGYADPKSDPISWILASGTRSTNLHEYLEGCEYSGAEHVKHPFLLHLFAQQTIHQFVTQGVIYAELRAAIAGYENIDEGFSFADACTCLCEAFGQAQRIVLARYQTGTQREDAWLWHGLFEIESLFELLQNPEAQSRFPCKVSIILTGKRHKSSRMLLREAGAGAVMHSRPARPADSARKFVNWAIPDCRVVGFDLAGQEDDHPPHQFRAEYEQLARLHIPVTVHAGENAPAEFVESAVLDLRARRLGHGLSLADDPLLMARARDDGICVELCPVSNFQTNAILPHGQEGAARVYPLRKFMENGISVCINTDNPVISSTNMVKECFQASYAFGGNGLSLWDLLRILRAGFVHAFLSLPERRALLELADQLVFDLFSRDEVLTLLRAIPPVVPPRSTP